MRTELEAREDSQRRPGLHWHVRCLCSTRPGLRSAEHGEISGGRVAHSSEGARPRLQKGREGAEVGGGGRQRGRAELSTAGTEQCRQDKTLAG